MSQWRNRNKTHSLYSELNHLQNVYFRIFVVWKLTEWCCFLTHLWNNPRIMPINRVALNMTKITKLQKPIKTRLNTINKTVTCSTERTHQALDNRWDSSTWDTSDNVDMKQTPSNSILFLLQTVDVAELFTRQTTTTSTQRMHVKMTLECRLWCLVFVMQILNSVNHKTSYASNKPAPGVDNQ